MVIVNGTPYELKSINSDNIIRQYVMEFSKMIIMHHHRRTEPSYSIRVQQVLVTISYDTPQIVDLRSRGFSDEDIVSILEHKSLNYLKAVLNTQEFRSILYKDLLNIIEGDVEILYNKLTEEEILDILQLTYEDFKNLKIGSPYKAGKETVRSW